MCSQPGDSLSQPFNVISTNLTGRGADVCNNTNNSSESIFLRMSPFGKYCGSDLKKYEQLRNIRDLIYVHMNTILKTIKKLPRPSGMCEIWRYEFYTYQSSLIWPSESVLSQISSFAKDSLTCNPVESLLLSICLKTMQCLHEIELMVMNSSSSDEASKKFEHILKVLNDSNIDMITKEVQNIRRIS